MLTFLSDYFFGGIDIAEPPQAVKIIDVFVRLSDGSINFCHRFKPSHINTETI